MTNSQKNLNKSSSITEIFPIVGVGASAGGIDALITLFSNIKDDINMAFILILHLDPTRKSELVDILKRITKINVFQIEENMKVEKNCIYIIPPNKEAFIINGILYLNDRSKIKGYRSSIDSFLGSLATDQKNNAICLILSGTGFDGTKGLKQIKENGGVAIVQDKKTSKYSEMPTNANINGIADFVSPIGKIADILLNYKNLLNNKDNVISNDSILNKIFNLVHYKTGYDFSLYKKTTIIRRIEKRMSLNKIETFIDYLEFLQKNPEEINALYEDFFIGVTDFFRDRKAFDVLENKIIPQLFQNKIEGDTIRIWIAGCGTGEEAYSIAILIMNYIIKFKKNYIKIQIFATDIDKRALQKARLGRFPQKINVNPEYLEQFFYFDNDSYYINKNIREMIIFSEHNLIKDPPFLKLDLISCRNLFIYLKSEVQKQIILLFNHALNNNGYLFLGNSENLNDLHNLFFTIDRREKIFRSKGVKNRLPFILYDDKRKMHFDDIKTISTKISIEKLANDIILKKYTPPHIIVDYEDKILYFSENVANYFNIPVGKANLNLYQMVNESLRLKLRSLLYKVKKENRAMIDRNLNIIIEDKAKTLNLIIEPMIYLDENNIKSETVLIIFEEIHNETIKKQIDKNLIEPSSERSLIESLEFELNFTKEYLQTTIEELETSNEDAKSSNEELISMNEELQSTNEELETSKEELQSLNEELKMVNQELQVKIDEVIRINSDLNNLIKNIDSATLFLDNNLCITRFTPSATKIFNLINADIGRPFDNFSSIYSNFITDIKSVIENHIPIEKHIITPTNKNFILKIVPYITLNNDFEGAIITITDITELMEKEEIILKFSFTLKQIPAIVVITNIKGEIEYVNPKFTEVTGYNFEEVIGKNSNILKSNKMDNNFYKDLWETILSGKQWSGDFCNKNRNGIFYWESASISAIKDNSDKIINFVKVSEDITLKKEIEHKLIKSNEEKELILREVNHRIKNNISLIVSLLSLQSSSTKNQEAKSILQDVKNRVFNISKLYEKMFIRDNYQNISMRTYFNDLIDNMESIFTEDLKKIIIERHIDDFNISTKLIFPIAVLVNELLTNIMKYAFVGKDDGLVKISLTKNENHIKLIIKDNGKGLPENFDIDKTQSFGFYLIKTLCRQLGGNLIIENDNGTKCSLEFDI